MVPSTRSPIGRCCNVFRRSLPAQTRKAAWISGTLPDSEIPPLLLPDRHFYRDRCRSQLRDLSREFRSAPCAIFARQFRATALQTVSRWAWSRVLRDVLRDRPWTWAMSYRPFFAGERVCLRARLPDNPAQSTNAATVWGSPAAA